MKLLRKVRFTLATVMMLVVTMATASALFVKVRHLYAEGAGGKSYLKVDAPVLFVGSIGLTAVALGALKCHSGVQTMLQATLACLGFLSLIGIAETGRERPLLYWFQISFGVLVTLPLLGRRVVKTEMERGPRRAWWMKTFEAIFFSFLTMMLVFLGLFIQWLAYTLSEEVLKL